MSKKIKAIDDYISKSAVFAQLVLQHFRDLVHNACPDVEEKMKWSFPHFDYKNEMMCSMAAFKQHCAISFWKGSLMKDKKLMENAKAEQSMGHVGRITSLKDLPSDKVLTGYIKEAMKLNDEGIKVLKPVSKEKKTIEVPDYFLKALSKNKKASQVFEAFAYSHKKEYMQWITEAKTQETRNKRMATAVEWISEGKGRNWRYQK
ncbi:MAG: YdeI/OmpD-associated family protein [Ferruginibacter sp.]